MLRQKVAGVDLRCVVSNERAPGLAVARSSSIHHVATNGARRVPRAELERELLGDPVLAPSDVVVADATDERDVLGVDARATAFPRPPATTAARVATAAASGWSTKTRSWGAR
jgi:hypothetical protein